MKRWAQIVNEYVGGVLTGVVLMVVEQDTQPQVSGVWVECPYEVGPGWLYDNGVFSPPPEEPAS